MASVVKLLEDITGEVWADERAGFNNRSVVMTCPKYPGYTVVWNSWCRVYQGKEKLLETRNFDPECVFRALNGARGLDVYLPVEEMAKGGRE